MSEKRKRCARDDPNKKKRKLHTIETKMEIIRRSESGESFASIGRSLGLNRSTICTLLKNKNKIKEYVQNSGIGSAKVLSNKHGIAMNEMERSLSLWMEEQRQNDSPLNFPTIKAKALSLHDDWKTILKEKSNFVFRASYGWFKKFKKRYPFHDDHDNNTGDLSADSTGPGNDAAAEELISSLEQIIEYEIHTESVEEIEPVKIVKTLTIKNMNEAFMHLDKFLAIIEECDSDTERVSQVRREIEKATECYRTLYQEIKKNGIQLTIDQFITRTPRTT